MKVKTQSVEVNWVCKGFTRTGAGTDKLKSPPNVVEGDDLKRYDNKFMFCYNLTFCPEVQLQYMHA